MNIQFKLPMEKHDTMFITGNDTFSIGVGDNIVFGKPAVLFRIHAIRKLQERPLSRIIQLGPSPETLNGRFPPQSPSPTVDNRHQVETVRSSERRYHSFAPNCGRICFVTGKASGNKRIAMNVTGLSKKILRARAPLDAACFF